MSSLISYLRIPIIASSGIAALLSGVLYFKQNEIIYPRNIPAGSRTDVIKPSQAGILDSEELMIPTPDGEYLSAFLTRPANSRISRNITILMFHGNAGNIGYRLPIAKILSDDLGCNVLLLQYRGYGLSTGTPNENGLTIDAQAGLDFLRQRVDLKSTKLIIYGQSLGGAVGVKLATKNEKSIHGIILENTFLSMRKMIPAVFPPARYLAPFCHEIWPTEDLLPEIRGTPILFLSGLRDEIVPAWHMKHLFNSCRSKTKIWKEFPHGSHNDTVIEPGYFEHIERFIEEHVMD